MTALAPTNWNIQDIESITDWASKLAIISSSIVAKYQCILLEYDVRLTADKIAPSLALEITQSHNSSQIRSYTNYYNR